MTIYLTMVRVLANVDAGTAQEAQARLVAALDRAGFSPYPEGAEPEDTYESEADEPSGIPAQYDATDPVDVVEVDPSDIRTGDLVAIGAFGPIASVADPDLGRAEWLPARGPGVKHGHMVHLSYEDGRSGDFPYRTVVVRRSSRST